MTQAKTGDTVKIHYTGRLKDGTVFDSSQGRDPLEFTLGSGMVIPGFDQGVTGMNVGESRQIEIPADQAYGPHHPQLVGQIPTEHLPPDLQPEVGMGLRLQRPDGQPIDAMVTEVSPEAVTVDANHPLAGQDLFFALELVDVK